jgi:hypothetical protein
MAVTIVGSKNENIVRATNTITHLGSGFLKSLESKYWWQYGHWSTSSNISFLQ